MEPLTIGIITIIILFLLLALGIHIGIALATAGFIGLAIITDARQAIWVTTTAFYHKIASPDLITLPLFILMGFAASGGGISQKLFNSMALWLSGIRGGLGMASIGGCTAFGAVCGSSLVTTAVFAKICAPEMRKHGYDKKLAYAICAAAGSIGMLIPPSVLAIVYGMLSGISIGKMLMAGVMPGLLWGILFCLTVVIIGKIRPSWMKTASQVKVAPLKEKIKSLISWWPIVIVAVVTFGGIYGGIFSPSEAAAVAAFLLLVIYLAIVRDLSAKQKVKEVGKMFTETATTSALIFVVIGAATVFSNFIVLTGISAKMSAAVLGSGLPPWGIVLVFAFSYLILGCFLDSISMLCITIPVFQPIIVAAGIDPIWYATIVIVSVEMGLITPPVGLNLYAAKGVAESDVTLEDVISGIIPFLIAEVVSVFIIFQFPILSTYLPSFVGK
ncbi:MAG: Sialic acid TRAP transporter permease protein SiaT [Smithella sp. PtaU1.Bin162]|nr:MAG: Sialic acid TRAP transporter permease protein SiaT [Smithella sp. PtaU1.Bin162]